MRLIDEARQAGIKVAVCSAATKSSVIHVVKSLLGDERFEVSSRCHCLCISPLNQPKSVCSNPKAAGASVPNNLISCTLFWVVS